MLLSPATIMEMLQEENHNIVYGVINSIILYVYNDKPFYFT